MQCLILAGGLGTRMRPFTESVPKALLSVAGRPFADWQLEWLASQGVDNVLYSVGHLGDAIEEYVGDGRRWGIELRYVREEGQLAGTAGAIRLAAASGMLDDMFFLLYGDSYLSVDLAAVEDAFDPTSRAALMTVFRNRGQWERSNAVFRDGLVTYYTKDCSVQTPDMEYIDYGLSVLKRAVVEEMVPLGQTADLAPLLTTLSIQGRLAGFEATERFYEIGSPQGLRDLEHLLRQRGD